MYQANINVKGMEDNCIIYSCDYEPAPFGTTVEILHIKYYQLYRAITIHNKTCHKTNPYRNM